MVHESRALTAELLHQQRVVTNFAAMETIAKNMRERVTPPEQAHDYLLEVSRAWETLGGLL